MKEACEKYNVPASKIGFWSRSMRRKKGVRGRKPVDPNM